jgi:hypothetical protein
LLKEVWNNICMVIYIYSPLETHTCMNKLYSRNIFTLKHMFLWGEISCTETSIIEFSILKELEKWVNTKWDVYIYHMEIRYNPWVICGFYNGFFLLVIPKMSQTHTHIHPITINITTHGEIQADIIHAKCIQTHNFKPDLNALLVENFLVLRVLMVILHCHLTYLVISPSLSCWFILPCSPIS